MIFYNNRSLFSDYYLTEILPNEKEFKEPNDELKKIYQKIKELYNSKDFSPLNEPQLRKHFIDKVFELLGWVYDVEPPTPSGEYAKHPDYALFSNKKDLEDAQSSSREGYFKKSLCLGEAKKWERTLDKKIKDDPEDAHNPSLQISYYLWLSGVKWGILTNGRKWRLYERERSKRLDIFYEIDLEKLLNNNLKEEEKLFAFKYFYLFFSKDGFPDLVEKVLKGSIDYAEKVGEELKNNIYLALKLLAEGFLFTSGNNLNDSNIKEIHDNSLIFLYRILFILYAEYRSLLPLGANKYYTETYSMDAIKKECANELDKGLSYPGSTYRYWNRLNEIFEIINRGNDELDVPAYNGGLFDPEKHPFLENNKVGDSYIARVIDLLTRSKDKAFIDYGSLEIRHLGSIYEGLLEYRLKVADDDLVCIKENKKEVYIPLEQAKNEKKRFKEEDIVRAPHLYLVTDKGERKATGSYYTPDYIVKYIIENTIGPVVKEKKEKIAKEIEKIEEKIKSSRRYNRVEYERQKKELENSIIDEILSIKVLDPAMGSGHFLVEATDYLARELLTALGEAPKEIEEDEIRWARREIVEKCIFGVDINPLAVELAKLSLWLYTVAKNRPLNFLDHHLRCGNSLIGARIEDLATFPELKKKNKKEKMAQIGVFENYFKQDVNRFLNYFDQIEKLPSDNVSQINEKKNLYKDYRNLISRFVDIADIWTSLYFGNELEVGNYQILQENLRESPQRWRTFMEEPWFKKAKEIAKEKRFFHWELEFPEIFFEGHRRKENPGFDVVVGNPPYDILAEKERKEI
ncbi:MAG: N-6 DNA methylase, partial [Deltaproteobacteria bacterium]|nr:N-6 DNA methylase [Deltaproteobacteria bacterium]